MERKVEHTMLFVQPSILNKTRTYSSFDTVKECLEGICKIYEEHLKRQNPNAHEITYNIYQLFAFLDELADICCLVYKQDLLSYAAFNKAWIKEKIVLLLEDMVETQQQQHPKRRNEASTKLESESKELGKTSLQSGNNK